MRQSIMKAATEHGCFWFDAWQILGGQGAFARLSEESEAKVQKDQIHLTIKGYREIGATMFDALVEGYGTEKVAGGARGTAR
jgi:lysophospholipase L1-like esterase